MTNIKDTVELLIELGFTIHADKSILVPTQKIVFLGFIINTVDMTLTLTPEKKQKNLELCHFVTTCKELTIRIVAILIGNFTAAMEAVHYAKLHYRSLENSKICALKQNNRGNFEAPFELSEGNKREILWWEHNIMGSQRSLSPLPIDKVIFTDASKKGWGGGDNGQC